MPARRALAAQVATRLGDHFAARDGLVVHLGSGIELALVPGGPSVMGALAAEQAHFDDATFLDDPRHRDVVESGELDALRRATLASVPARRTRLAPFLLATAPMTRAQAEALGLVKAGVRAPRIFGSQPADPIYFLPGELDAAKAPHGLRLPTEAEWEHACRHGGSTPFRWGAELPSAPIDPPHPLGLRQLGFHRERCAGDFRPSYDPEAQPTADGVARGGAAALYPWQTGCAEWTLLLPHRRVRLTPDEIDGQHAVRWALDVPGLEAPSEEREPLDEPIAQTGPSEETRALASALRSSDRSGLAEALDGVIRMAGRGVWSAQCAHLVPALVGALGRVDDDVVARTARALAALSAGDPGAFSATGFDPARAGWRAACATNAARATRAAVAEAAAEVAALLSRSSAKLRTHVAFLLPLVAPDSPSALDALSKALARETDEHALSSEAVAHGLIARRCGSTTAPPVPLLDGPVARAARVLAVLPLGHPPEAEDREALVEAARTSTVDPDLIPWRDGRADMLIAFHLDQHDPRPLAAARFLARLARAAGAAHVLATSYVSGALALGFQGRRLASARALDEAEREVLEDLSTFEMESPRVTSSFEAIGVPGDAAARRAWLAS